MSKLARSCYVHPSTLSRYERGIMQPGNMAVVQIARELQVTPQDIDPEFNQKLLIELGAIDKSLQEIELLQDAISTQQQKVAELQRAISIRQKFVAAYLVSN